LKNLGVDGRTLNGPWWNKAGGREMDCLCYGEEEWQAVLNTIMNPHMPTPVFERSKGRVWGRSLAGIAGSNPAEGMDVSLLSVVCVFATGGSLVQRNHTECGVSLCDLESPSMRRSWPALGCCARQTDRQTDRETHREKELSPSKKCGESFDYLNTLLHRVS
jgi:hypothetical protein